MNIMDLESLEAELSELPLYCYFFIDTEELTFSDRIRYICENECPMYGKTWACPPGTGTVSQCRNRCLSFKDAFLLSTVSEVNDITDIEETLATRKEHEIITAQAAEIFKSRGCEVYVLSSEACAVCEECAYPQAPCRHPEIMNPCIESHGIVLSSLAEKHGIEFQYGGNVVTWFSLVFYR